MRFWTNCQLLRASFPFSPTVFSLRLSFCPIPLLFPFKEFLKLTPVLGSLGSHRCQRQQEAWGLFLLETQCQTLGGL